MAEASAPLITTPLESSTTEKATDGYAPSFKDQEALLGKFERKLGERQSCQSCPSSLRAARLDLELCSHSHLPGWHEKFNVMRHNTGEAPVIVMVAALSLQRSTYSNGLTALSAQLTERIQALLDHPENGLLKSSVQLSTTKKPRFKVEPAIGAADVLLSKTLTFKHAEGAAASRVALMEQVVQAEVRDTAIKFRLEDSLPLWCVSLYDVQTQHGDEHEHEQRRSAIVALSVHHCISDGKGTQALLSAILFGKILQPASSQAPGASFDEKTSAWAHDQQSIAPTSDKTLPMDPPFFRLIVPLALTKFVMPKLAPMIPPFIRRKYTRKPAWPALRSKPSGKASKNEPPVRWLSRVAPERTVPEVRLVSYDSSELIDGLKGASKSNDVASIHSTIHAAMVVALAAALKAFGGTDDYVYASETPIDHRSPEALGHGTYTGNYIGVCWWREEIRRATSFWAIARDYAALVSDEKKRRKALISIGLLKYLKATPVNGSVTPASTADMVGVEAATGWEKWWLEKAMGRRPNRVSAGLSNLGVNPLDGAVCQYGSGESIEADSVAMFQCPSAIGPAIDVDVMGYRRTDNTGALQGGLNLSVSWRSDVVDEKIPAYFTQALAALGPLIALGSFHREITVGEAVDLLLPTLLPAIADTSAFVRLHLS